MDPQWTAVASGPRAALDALEAVGEHRGQRLV
jgi:hypothetical protein